MAATLSEIGGWFGKTSPYSAFAIDSFHYEVENKGDRDEQLRVAVRLHQLNCMSVAIIGAVRRLLYAAHEGKLIPEHRDINIKDLAVFYERLRRDYSPDKVYEALSSHSGSSYVINQGEEMHMCVRGENKAILVAVLTHELTHVGSSTPDHDTEFWYNLKVMQRVVSYMGIVNRQDVESGGKHCGRVAISKEELLRVSCGCDQYPRGTSVSRFVPGELGGHKESPRYAQNAQVSVSRFAGAYPQAYYGARFHSMDRSGELLDYSVPFSVATTKWT